MHAYIHDNKYVHIYWRGEIALSFKRLEVFRSVCEKPRVWYQYPTRSNFANAKISLEITRRGHAYTVHVPISHSQVSSS